VEVEEDSVVVDEAEALAVAFVVAAAAAA